MLFIYPMWDSESQRIGKQKCTPLGYAFHTIAELLGFAGVLLLLIVVMYFGYEGVTNTFQMSPLWLLVIPFGFGIFGEALYQLSWLLARRRGFEYDYDMRVASWNENGTRVTCKWNP